MRRATAYRALAQYDRAVQDLEEAVAIEPNNKELTQLLAKVRAQWIVMTGYPCLAMVR